jgi:glutamate/tyrosine decarboxylase-like PLP-dependent enzyme
MSDKLSKKEIGFDPDNWDEFRAMGHKVFDEMIDSMEVLGERPTWMPIPEDSVEFLKKPLSNSPRDYGDVYEEFKTHVMPYSNGNTSPRYWGWANGAGTPEGILSGLLMNTMHTPNILHQHAGLWVELQVIEWLKDIMNYPATASGVLTSGGSMANYTGLAAARRAKIGETARRNGMTGHDVKGYTVYSSSETHYSVSKAWDALGLGYDNSRAIPVDDDYQMDMDALKAAIAMDKASGYVPVVVVGTLMTINTAAIDPLNDIADVAEANDMWFHVDACIGCALGTSKIHKALMAGSERADSFAADLHKWFQQPYDVGFALVNPGHLLEETFSFDANYITNLPGTLSDAHVKFSDRGLELSRGFRALPTWISLQTRGIDQFGDMIDQNIEQAQYLVGLVNEADDMELLAPSPHNIVNFRYAPAHAKREENGVVTNADLNELNKAILTQLQRRGIAAPSSTTLKGNFSIRACNINQRTRRADFDILVNAVRELGQELLVGAES